MICPSCGGPSAGVATDLEPVCVHCWVKLAVAQLKHDHAVAEKKMPFAEFQRRVEEFQDSLRALRYRLLKEIVE